MMQEHNSIPSEAWPLLNASMTASRCLPDARHLSTDMLSTVPKRLSSASKASQYPSALSAFFLQTPDAHVSLRTLHAS